MEKLIATVFVIGFGAMVAHMVVATALPFITSPMIQVTDALSK